MGIPVVIDSEDLALVTHACLQSDRSTNGQVCAASRALEILKAAGLGPDGKEKPLTVNGKPSPTSSASCATLTSTPAHGRKEHDMGKLVEIDSEVLARFAGYSMPNEMTPERLAEIRARCDAATEGPWKYQTFGSGSTNVTPPYPMTGPFGSPQPPADGVIRYFEQVRQQLCDRCEQNALHWVGANHDAQERHDLKFIAHARTDIPDLLDEVERLQAENKKLRESTFMAQEQCAKEQTAVDVLHSRIAELERLVAAYKALDCTVAGYRPFDGASDANDVALGNLIRMGQFSHRKRFDRAEFDKLLALARGTAGGKET